MPDIAYCPGSGSDAEGWREGCDDCARRLLPRTGDVNQISPPPIIAFFCEYHVPIADAVERGEQ